ncbi:keratin, type I cytoskeletal 13 isoform X2 [Amia ocellicauda]|uniref:keratin, type I cytoskeletal 13 isoform X2 n=1 Tax=Amia ocellicauda TaxID=2972642 RepID=UPI003464466B
MSYSARSSYSSSRMGSGGQLLRGSPSMLTASKSMSVFGEAGGYGARISSASSANSSLSNSMDSGNSMEINQNGKQTMQNLNDRLATYLAKVRSLEMANAELEKQIHDWYNSHTVVSHDYTSYSTTIDDLRGKIGAASTENAKLSLSVDNAKLAADDFRMKSENELAMRQSLEVDIGGLRRVLDELTLVRADLEMQIEGLKEDLVFLKKNHEEELATMQTHLSGQVNVAVDAAPGVDLTSTMAEIREQYEAAATKNNRELEAWYQTQATTVQEEVTLQNEAMQTTSVEFKELKSRVQNLQIELQSCHSMKASLEVSLAETQARYSAQLSNQQAKVSSLEAQLSQLRAAIEEEGARYRTLLDIKIQLEMEIAEYRRLLDGEDLSTATSHTEATKSTTTRVVTIVEETVDGKVVKTSSK